MSGFITWSNAEIGRLYGLERWRRLWLPVDIGLPGEARACGPRHNIGVSASRCRSSGLSLACSRGVMSAFPSVDA